MPKGSSLRPKWSRYNVRRPVENLLPLDVALLTRIHALQALLRLPGNGAPGLLALDDGGAHQDDQFALAVRHALLAEKQAQAGHAADPGQAVAAGVLFLAHQAADGNDAAILDTDDAVGFVDRAGSERQREGAQLAAVDVL